MSLPIVPALVAGAAGAGATTAAVAQALNVGFFFKVGAFFGTTALGGALAQVGLGLGINSLLNGGRRQPGQQLEPQRFNVRLEEFPRNQSFGSCMVGGHVGIFSEFDNAGNFWYICAHTDNELTGTPAYYLDGELVTVSDGTDGFTAGDVTTDQFCLNDQFETFEGSGTKVPYFRLYTVTPTTATNVGARPSAFASAFPGLAADFKLAGVAYTVIRCRAAPLEHRAKIMRWRGAIGIGEPTVEAVATWDRCYDPRDVAQDEGDPTTWQPTSNPALIWGRFRTARYGKNRPSSEVNWASVGTAADVCDETVFDRDGNSISRYLCGLSFPDGMPRWQCEAEILKCFDAFVAHDSQGRAYPVPGSYVVAGAQTFHIDRDIVEYQTEAVNDGESPVDGVVVSYTSPMHGYTRQAAAPWVNSAYFDGVGEGNYLTIDALGVQSHNQAVRLAKAIGQRVAAPRRVALATSPKGFLVRRDRFIDLTLSPLFSGYQEIVTPVQEAPDGSAYSFAVVPVGSDRWDLNPGEEGAPPAIPTDLSPSDPLPAAQNVVVVSEQITNSAGASVRFKVTVDAPLNAGLAYIFRYRVTGSSDPWLFMSTDMQNTQAISAVVSDGSQFDIEYRTTSGLRNSSFTAFSGNPVTAVANPTAPNDLVTVSGSGGAGQATIDYTTANDSNQNSVAIYRNTVDNFGTATLVINELAGANVSSDHTNTGLAAGTYYFWAEPRNGSGIAGNETATGAVMVL